MKKRGLDCCGTVPEEGKYGMEFIIWIVFRAIMFAGSTLVAVSPISDPTWKTGLGYYSLLCANILGIYIFRKYLCNPGKMRLLSRKGLKCGMWAIVIGIGICLGHRIFFLIFLGFVEQSIQEIGETALTNLAMFLATVPGILYEAFLEPAAEEVCFRGIIFPVAREKRGNMYAVIVSSLLFALAHGNGIQFISALFMGVVIGYAVILTGNVSIGIIIHVVNNSFSVFMSNILNEVWNVHGYMQIIFGIILLLFGILMLRRENGSVFKEMSDPSYKDL